MSLEEAKQMYFDYNCNEYNMKFDIDLMNAIVEALIYKYTITLRIFCYIFLI